MTIQTFLTLAIAGLAHAHFGIEYPPMRGDTLSSHANETWSQWTNPCKPAFDISTCFHPRRLVRRPGSKYANKVKQTGAGVPSNLTGRPITPWPLTGGSLKLDLHHPWTYIFVNLGLGSDVSNFNYTLTRPFWNETGNGTLCVPRLELPADLPVRDGSPASLQVVTVGEDGNALYNCADIVFREDAKVLSGDECRNSEGVTVAPVVVEADDDAAGNNTTAGDKGSAGSAMGVNTAALSSVVGLAMVFVAGLSM
ncbi:hypothetical protein MYCTH_2307988 [Thermothelomyces thermophilus ATCC 42464]|uniref:Copper acquisition factor BIM1-like domain-containing protein n=1 Tax=Thermothelomyces thermophilus (strain ATCC 42464 / BCRC 31852 / DSM 1799) TaxID=573729 RepID=G2QIU8_THET4|nr:uncharacterized protein MYCTH_2307988 [Thermothelomyces thermophilus ATCC 42464]AEO59576.1 hypothetical protein MYCTH_2307988 [Thermothelomyces thermophilus ATCC 42464]